MMHNGDRIFDLAIQVADLKRVVPPVQVNLSDRLDLKGPRVRSIIEAQGRTRRMAYRRKSAYGKWQIAYGSWLIAKPGDGSTVTEVMLVPIVQKVQPLRSVQAVNTGFVQRFNGSKVQGWKS